MTTRSRIHAIFSGEVQGVGFRYHARNIAEELGVSGWVRNLDDGRVELVAEGKSESLDELIKLLKDMPPRGGSVAQVELMRDEKPEGLEGFRVIIL